MPNFPLNKKITRYKMKKKKRKSMFLINNPCSKIFRGKKNNNLDHEIGEKCACTENINEEITLHENLINYL